MAAIDLATLASDVEHVIADVDSVVTFAQKYSSLLPPQVGTGLTALQTVLSLVQKVVDLVNPPAA